MSQKTTGKDKNWGIGIILLLISAALLAVCILLYRRECIFFHSIHTIRFSGHFLTYDIANVSQYIMAHLKNISGKYFLGYIIPLYLFLIPGIILMGLGLDKLLGRQIRIFEFLQDNKKEKNFLITVFILCFVAVIIIHFVVLLNYPMATDEFSYVFQSEIIASGKLYAPTPPSPESLTGANIVVNNGKWYSKYTIGWPLLLALGKVLGIPFIINALLSSGSLILLYLITRELFGRAAGALAIFMGLFSPYFSLQAGTYFPHTASGFFALLLILFVFRFSKEKKWTDSAIIGISICMLMLIRPADAGIICIGLSPWLIYIILKSENKVDTIKKMTPILGGFFLGIGTLMIVNHIQNGDPLLFSFIKYRSYDKWGFGQVRHTPIKGLWNITFAYLRMGFWVTPFITAGALLSFLRKKVESLFLIIIPLGFISFYFFFFAIGNIEFGSRYYFPAFLLLLPLAAGGIEGAGNVFQSQRWFPRKNFIPSFLILISIFMLVGVFPALLRPIRIKYSINRRLMDWLESPAGPEKKTITIIKNVPDKMTGTLIRNHWNYKEQTNIMAMFLLPEENRELIKKFPGREPYLIYFDYGKNNFAILPYPPEDKVSVLDYIFAGINYERSVGDVKKAGEAFEKAAELEPQNPSIKYNLGYLYFKTGRFKEASELLGTLVKTHPDFAEAYYFLGRSLGNMGRKREATEILILFVKKFPKSERVERVKDWINYYKN